MSATAVDNYLAAAPQPHRHTLTLLREMLRVILPQAEEVISYGVPTFKVDGKGVAGFAYYKSHCSYFPMSGTVLKSMATVLESYEQTKGSLHFAIDQPLPESVVRKLVEVRLGEIGVRE